MAFPTIANSLLGNVEKINKIIQDNQLELEGVEIIDPRSDAEAQRRREYAEILYNKRQRYGVTIDSADEVLIHRNYFAPMMVEAGQADAMISGLVRNYPDTLNPAIEIIGKKPDARLVSGMYIINTKKGSFFFSDCSVNKNPTMEDLIEITLQTVYAVEQFKIKPRVAFVSYSNFGSNPGRVPDMQRDAVAYLHKHYPDLVVDGEMQVNVALNPEIQKEHFPFSKLVDGPANVFIFPYLTAGNIAYKLLQVIADAEVIGPVINGMNKSVHVLQIGSSVTEIVNMVCVAAIDAMCVKSRLAGDEGCK